VFSHQDGYATSSGFVYRGALMPPLQGKYFFGDIANGRIFFCDMGEMIAADDTNRNTVAAIHELQVVTNGVAVRMFDLIAAAYALKGGTARALPGGLNGGNDPYGVPYGGGRADIRIVSPGDGEAYVLSKSDGMIRKMVAALIPPIILSAKITNGTLTLTWQSISNHQYRVQYRGSLLGTNWTNLPGDVTATGASASKTDVPAGTRFYRLMALP